MHELTLTKTRFFEGVWEGILTKGKSGDNSVPKLEVTLLEQPVASVELTENREQGYWVVRVAVPASVLGDGLQTFLIRDVASGETLESFAILSGEALADDIRAEMDLLRAELDMLKRAFRRHCLETM